MLKYVLPFCLVLVACDTYVEEQRSVDFEPIYLENSEEEVAQEDACSDVNGDGALNVLDVVLLVNLVLGS